MARALEGVWATVGLHPHDAIDGVDTIAQLLTNPAPVVVGVGECGLDYHYDHSPRPVQREAFAAQVRLARQLDLALVVHSRNAWEDTFAILATEGVPDRWVLHCFTGGPAEARRGLDLGGYLSFSGIVTFKSADDVRRRRRSVSPRAAAGGDGQSLLGARPVPGPDQHPLAGAGRRGGSGGRAGVAPEVVEEATWANTATVFRLPPVEIGSAGGPAVDEGPSPAGGSGAGRSHE